MQKFKVITLSLGGHSNKIFQSQDIVTVADFPSEENVLQHILTGGLHPLNEDGSEMERVIITQEMIDEMPEEQKQIMAKSGIVVKPGMRTYKPNWEAAAKETEVEEPAEVEENVETVMDTTDQKIGDATDEPRTEVGNDQPLVEEPKETPTAKSSTKKANGKK